MSEIEQYSYDLNYFFNSENIPNQDLVFEMFDFFETGEGRNFYFPIDFLNILAWKKDFIFENIDRPIDILNHFKNLETERIKRHLILAFLLKWFGGYPINNLNGQLNTVLKLIERQYLAFIEEAELDIERKIDDLRITSENRGLLLNYETLKRKVNQKELIFLKILDKLVNRNVAKENTNNNITLREIPKENVNSSNPTKELFIFISHSSKDKQIVGDFIDKILKLCLKVETDQIFCTSFEESSIKSGEDFRKAIRENLIKSTLAILIITDNYRESEVCLNEMGAIWALNQSVVPFILSPIRYDSVGFIHQPNQLLKINEKTNIIKFIDEQKTDTNKIKHNEIERHVTDFLKIFESGIKLYTPEIKKSVVEKDNDIDINEHEIIAINNRDGLYIFQNGSLRHIADDSLFSLTAYGFDTKEIRSFDYKNVVELIDVENSIPLLHKCKIIVDTETLKLWLLVGVERRFLPKSVYSVLVKKDSQPNIVHLSHQEVMKISEGDKLNDVTDILKNL